jgi:hypothetical protein
LVKEWRDGFTSAGNQRVGPLYVEPSTIDHTSGAPDTYATSAEESEVSTNEFAFGSYPIEEPKTSADELASFSDPAEEPETGVDKLVFTLILALR